MLSPRGSTRKDADMRFKYISALKTHHGHLVKERDSFLAIPDHVLEPVEQQ